MKTEYTEGNRLKQEIRYNKEAAGNRIEQLRKSYGMSREEMAEAYILLGQPGQDERKMGHDGEEWKALELLRHLPPKKRTYVLQSTEIFSEMLGNRGLEI